MTDWVVTAKNTGRAGGGEAGGQSEPLIAA